MSAMAHSLGYNDAVLFMSLLYSSLDLVSEWDAFGACSRPVHHWLLVSYSCVLSFRLLHVLGAWTAGEQPAGEAGDGLLLDFRHKTAIPRLLSYFTWLVAVPFFFLLTVLGTSWLWSVRSESPQCMPTTTHFWFAAFWMVLSYIWVLIYVVVGAAAAVLERRRRRAESSLREMEDADVISRWGHVSQLSGYHALAVSQGMEPSEIRALPGEGVLTADLEAEAGCELECSICLTACEAGERVRRLPGCNHMFHKACIDLWLLRSAACPLCKRSVQTVEDAAAERA